MNLAIIKAALGKAYYVVRDFMQSPVGFVTVVLRFKKGTNFDRWAANSSLQPAWDERTMIMSGLIRPGESIVEFGAGAQVMRNALPKGCSYTPVDLVARTSDTVVCDLNSQYPRLDMRCDVAIFSGVLEYVEDIPSLFDWLFRNFDRVIFSYATSEHTPSPVTRKSYGWINEFSGSELQSVVDRSGFFCKSEGRWNGHVIFTADRS